MIDNRNSNELTRWKRINMRSVAHLLGVEFLHDLYNRYDPTINSIRFRHTITIWKNGIVNSYAPEYWWDRIGELLGYQFYTLDPILLKSINRLYGRNREDFYGFIKYLKNINLSSLSNTDLSSLLIKFQSIVLGDLYVLNFVQVEHGLNTAVKKVLFDITKDKNEAEKMFANFIKSEKITESQKEKRALSCIAMKWKILKIFNFFNEEKAKFDVEKHCKKYQHLYSAYGEEPRSFDLFWSDFLRFIKEKSSFLPVFFPRLLNKKARKILRKLKNKKLNILIPLLVEGGFFRDKNKALLGQSIKYRFAIFDEIANRNIEDRINLNYYLLSEIVDLLIYSKKIKKEIIESRKYNGVVLTRSEEVQIDSGELMSFLEDIEQKKVLIGQCASQGLCTGECKIVLTKDDSKKIKNGDIMIAIGTDFDLIEAMYRSAAVITEEGGILSHASIVCRELGKPCCIGVKDATRLLKDGQIVKVDAVNGKIFIL